MRSSSGSFSRGSGGSQGGGSGGKGYTIQVGVADPGDPPDTVKMLNPLAGVKLPPHLQGSPSRSPAARAVGGSGQGEHLTASPSGQGARLSNSNLSEAEFSKARAEYEAAAAASGLPSTDEVWSSIRDPLKGVKLTTKKRRLKTVQNCFSGKDGIDWFLARYPKLNRAHGQLLMQQLLDKDLLLPAAKGSMTTYEDSESCLVKLKVVNDSAGHLTLTIREAAGMLDKGGELYCNLDVKYKKSEVSLTANHWKTQLCKGPNPKWNATFKVPSRVLPQHLQFEAQVFAKHSVGANTFLGQVEIPLDPLSGGETLEDWFPLQMRRQGEEVRGEILLSLTFTSVSDDEDKMSSSSSSARLSSSSLLGSSETFDEFRKDDMGLVDVDDPADMLAEIPYEFDNPELQQELLLDKLPSGSIEYKAASLVKLVELLSSADIAAGSSIVDDVLLTYPTFTTGLRLFNLFLKRYIGPPDGTEGIIAAKQASSYTANKKDIQNRVGSFLARWMTSSTDFSDNPILFSYFKKVVDMNFFAPTPSLAKYFSKKFDECKKRRMGQDAGPPGIPGVSASSAGGTLRGKPGQFGTLRADASAAAIRQVPLLDLNTEEIAEQITLIEHELFRAIEPVELLNQNWNKHPELSPHVIEYIQWFNKMCQWAATEIIKEDQPESRAVIISKFIHIADRLAQLNNFNGLMEILASLEGSSIRRLKLSWAEIPQADAETLERLAQLMKPEKNFKDYRAAILNAQGKPWIPYLGLHLTDLTFVDDGNTTWLGKSNHLVNLQKAVMTAQCVKTVVDSAKIDFYGIRPMNSIQKLLYNVANSVFDENEVYRLSLLREARNAGGDAADRGRGNRNRLANIAKSMMKRSNVQAEKELTDADWGVVLEGARTVLFNKDSVIIKQGQLNKKMYMLQTGRVRVEKSSDGKDPIVLTTMLPPKVFGEMSIIMPDNKPAVSCIADADGTKLYETDYNELHKAFAQHPDLARRFYMTMAKKLSEMLIALVPPTKKKEDASDSKGSSTQKDSSNGGGGGGADDTEEGSELSSSQSGTLKKKKKKKKPVSGASADSTAGTPGTPEAADGGKARRRKLKKREGTATRSSGTFSAINLGGTEEDGSSAAASPAPAADELPPPPTVAGDGVIDPSQLPPPPSPSLLPPPPVVGPPPGGSLQLPKHPPPPPPPGGAAGEGGEEAPPAVTTPSEPIVRKVRKKKVVRRKRRPNTGRSAEVPQEDDAAKYLKTFGFVTEGPEAEKYISKFDASFKRFQGKVVLFERHFCFVSEMFMTTTKKIYPLKLIKQVEQRTDGVCLHTKSTQILFTFSSPDVMESACKVLLSLWEKVERTPNVDMGEDGVVLDKSGMKEDDLLEETQNKILTSTDWDLMLNGAKKVTFQDGEFIIKAGESYQKIYHILRGTCVVEVERDGQPVIINRMQENTTFGEMSFIKQSEDSEYRASANVVAVDAVEVSIIEGYFINILFDMHAGLEVRFFEYLCSVLANRVHKQTTRFK